MAQGAVTIPIETDFGGDDRYGRRLAFRAIHGVPRTQKTSENANLQHEEKLTLIFYVQDIQRLLCKDETP
jgi:hypothetical protein